MMKKLLVGALALALATVGGAQGVHSQRILFALYDLDSTTDISCSFADEVLTGGRATTSGSSVTTTSVSSSAVFGSIAVGDVIWATISGVKTGRVVTARASADSATVDSVWTLPAAGVSLRYQKPTCGASSGWVAVESGATTLNLTIDLSQVVLTSGGVAFKIEGRYSPLSTSTATNIWPGDASADAHCDAGTYASGYCVFTSADSVTITNAGTTFPSQIRLVADLTGVDNDTTPATDNEKITATLLVVK